MSTSELQAEVDALERRLKETKKRLAKALALQTSCSPQQDAVQHEQAGTTADEEESTDRRPLSAEEYKRYGRQMIMPEIGLQGQRSLDISIFISVFIL